MEITRFQSVLRFTTDIRRWMAPNIAIWIVYLAGYEWIMRGMLLYGSVEWIGVPAAVALNCVIYAVIHVHKGWEQVVGALPFGLLLCWVTLYANSIWPAYLLHLTLSLSMEFYVARQLSGFPVDRRSNSRAVYRD
jgi:membrane protease YdiL (CAAX protease family)